MRTLRLIILLLSILLSACGSTNPAASPDATAPAASSPASTTSAAASSPASTTSAAASSPASTTSAAPTTGTPAEASYPQTITDGLKRSVTIAAQPDRIISLAPSNTEILFAVGAGPHVIGDTTFCNYPPEAATLTKIGGFDAKTISIEKIVALKPDLVVASDASQQPVISALEQQHIAVLSLTAQTFDDVYANITMIGQVTGHAASARQLVADMQRRVSAVQHKTAAIPASQRMRVYWEVFDQPLISAGPGSFIGQMISLAGGTNIFADLSQEYPEVSAEAIIKRDPQVILGPDSAQPVLSAALLARRPGWAQITAVRNGQVHAINGDIVSRPGPRLADALEQVTAAIYPNLGQ